MATYTGINFDSDLIFNTWFIKKTLMYSMPELVLQQFTNQETLPTGENADKVKWVRRVAPASSNVATLTEGSNVVVSSTSTTFSLTGISASLGQYGISVGMSDLVTAQSGYNLIDLSQKLLGESVAIKVDDLLKTEVATNSSAAFRYPRGLTTKNWNTLNSTTGDTAKIDSYDILDLATNLKANNAPVFSGKGYIFASAPEILRDVVMDQGWRWPATYNAAEKIYNREVGKIHGMTVVETTNPWRENVASTLISTGSIYLSIGFGRDALGGVDFSQQPFRPRIYPITGADKFDIYNQIQGFAGKFRYAAKSLNTSWLIGLKSKPLYS